MNLSSVSTYHSLAHVRVFLESTIFDSFWIKLDRIICSKKQPDMFDNVHIKTVRFRSRLQRLS